MEKRERKVEYKTDEIVIVWRPDLCMHAGNCVHLLPDVYDVNEKRWIKPENASVSDLIVQIECCPTGALSYRLLDEEGT